VLALGTRVQLPEPFPSQIVDFEIPAELHLQTLRISACRPTSRGRIFGDTGFLGRQGRECSYVNIMVEEGVWTDSLELRVFAHIQYAFIFESISEIQGWMEIKEAYGYTRLPLQTIDTPERRHLELGLECEKWTGFQHPPPQALRN
jgi:hypothetical protein